MANNNAYSDSIQLPDVRLVWADIYEPGKGMNGGPPKYKVSVTFPPDSIAHQRCREQMSKVAIELWGGQAKAVIDAMDPKSKALREGNKKLDDKGFVRPEYENMFYVSASSGQDSPPLIIGPKKANNNWVEIGKDGLGYQNGILMNPQPYETTKPYRGCYVNIKVQFIASKSFTPEGKQPIPNQIYARFETVQYVRKGEAFGRGPASAEGFEEVPLEDGDGGEAPNPNTSGNAADLF